MMSRFQSRRLAIVFISSAWLFVLLGPGQAAETAATPKKATAVDIEGPSALGKKIPNFILPDIAEKQQGLADYSDKKFVVAVFMGTQCPIGNMYVPVLIDLQERYQDQGVQFLWINSYAGNTPAMVKQHAQKFELSFPVLVDADQRVADLFSARRTAEVFVLDARREVRYHGRIDDRFGYTFKRKDSRRNDLEIALQQLLAGKSVSVAETKTMGCLITKRRRQGQQGEITYAKHISRLIQKECQECHRPGTAAPFSLLSYDDAVNWSAMIKEVVVQRRMPPWHADPRYGEFHNERRLTQKETDMLTSWIDGGTPLGDKKDLPAEIQYAEGWQIGKPDIVLKMPKEVTIPASGEVAYKYFQSKMDIKEDMWIQAAEARPGNRAVVHHLILFYRMPADKQRQQSGLFRGWVVGVAPGSDPLILEPGMGRRIPAGAELWWQLHYTPTGKVEKDRSEVGLILCKKPPKQNVINRPIINTRFQIPAGAANHTVRSSRTFRQDARLFSFLPHMHLRGKDFLYRAVFPNGSSKILLSVPNYDFDWQHIYKLKEPLDIPRGTRIECVAHFDNSADNPANPNPKEDVRWGDQTWEEMMIGYVDFIYTGDRKVSSVER